MDKARQKWWEKNGARVNADRRRRYAEDSVYRREKIDSVLDRRRRNREFLAQYKLENGCCRCGYNDHPAALDLHHRDGEKKEFQLGGALVAFPRLKQELNKCDVLCANCHRILHSDDRGDILVEAVQI